MDDKIRYVFFTLALILLFVNYIAINNYMNSNASKAEQYAELINKGEACIEQVKLSKTAYDPLPLCEIRLKDILINSNSNITILENDFIKEINNESIRRRFG